MCLRGSTEIHLINADIWLSAAVQKNGKLDRDDMKTIVVEHVSLEIGGVEILKDVNLTLEEGNVYGLIGPNGSGKSMLLRVIAGNVRPTSGRVLYDGKELGVDENSKDYISFLPEMPELIAGCSGYENLLHWNEGREDIGDAEVRKAMQAANLEPECTIDAEHYGFGSKRRLAWAQVLLENKEVVLLDDPTRSMDRVEVWARRSAIYDMAKEGRIVLMTTYSGEELMMLCDSAFEILDGHLEKLKDFKSCSNKSK